jgi:hypothetical protein
VAAVWKEVRSITYGGDKLRQLIHDRVRTLEASRHNKFANLEADE